MERLEITILLTGAPRWHFLLAGRSQNLQGLQTTDWSLKPIISGSNLPEPDDSSRETDPALCYDGYDLMSSS